MKPGLQMPTPPASSVRIAAICLPEISPGAPARPRSWIAATRAAMWRIENRQGVRIRVDGIGKVPAPVSVDRAPARRTDWGE